MWSRAQSGVGLLREACEEVRCNALLPIILQKTLAIGASFPVHPQIPRMRALGLILLAYART